MTVCASAVRGVAVALLAPPAAAALRGSGVPATAAIAAAIVILGCGAWWARHAPANNIQMTPVGVVGWSFIALLALTQDARVSWYMADGTQLLASALPNGFVTVHECLSGYTEATRLALEGRVNIYDQANYKMPDGGPRYIVRREGLTEIYDDGRVRALFAHGDVPRVAIVHVDLYDYPPPFLVLPYTLGLSFNHDLFRTRALWFGLQALALWLAFLITLGWPAREPSTRGLAWLPALWLAPPTLVGLQYGNFQTGVMALSIIAMTAFTWRRDVAGGLLLGFATISKLFPGVLVVGLLVRRQWRAAALTAGWMSAIAALALAVFGRKPFDDFLWYQLPAIASGAAFSFNDRPQWVPTNYGVYALIAKMRLLGLPGMTHDAGSLFAAAYGVALIVLVVVIFAKRVVRDRPDGHSVLGGPIVWLALLNLAAIRSPYVGDGYAQVGSLWLLALVASSGQRTHAQWLGLAALFVVWAVTLEGFTPAQPPVGIVVFSIATQCCLIAFNLLVLIRAVEVGNECERLTLGQEHPASFL